MPNANTYSQEIPNNPPAEEPAAGSAPETGAENQSADDAVDWEAEAKKWKAMSRQNEERARANAEKAKAFDQLEEANKTELQKAQERAETLERELKQTRLQAKRAEFAAQYGVPANLITGANDEELEENAKALKEWRGEPQSAPAAPPASTPSTSAGVNGTPVGEVRQYTRADLQKMTPKEINDARKAGHLNELMGG